MVKYKTKGSVREHLLDVLKENVGKEFDVRDLTDLVEDSMGKIVDQHSIYTAIKVLRDRYGMNIVNTGLRMFKYIGDLNEDIKEK